MTESLCEQCENKISVELVTDEYGFEQIPTYHENGTKSYHAVKMVEPIIKDNKVIISACLYTNRDVQRDTTVVKQCSKFKEGGM